MKNSYFITAIIIIVVTLMELIPKFIIIFLPAWGVGPCQKIHSEL